MAKNKKLVIDFFEEVYNLRNFEYILDNFSDNYFEHRDDGARSNMDALKITKIACSIFPDLNVSIDQIIEENDLIAVNLSFTGTHKGVYLDIPGTSKLINWEAMEFFRIENNLITESWGTWPNHDILLKITKPD